MTGGFHLVMTREEEVRRVAPGHCTSELGFAVFLERFDNAGVGAILTLPGAGRQDGS